MTYFCPVESDLNKYQSILGGSEARDEAIAEEVERLMAPGGEFHPWTPANFAEALGEIAAAVGEKITLAASQYGAGNVSMAGATLKYAIEAYWKHLATNDAETTLDRQWLDRGAPDPDDRRDHEREDADGGYAIDDPKHSGYIDRALALIDQAKEARRG